jgi:hypothetical protein
MKTHAKFMRHATARGVVFIEPEFEAAVLALRPLEHSGLEEFLNQHSADPGPAGRTHTAIVELPNTSTRVHLRPVRHGGWLAGLLGSRQLGVARPLSELDVNHRLRAAHAPVPHPVFVLGYRRGGLWETAFASVFVERSLNGEDFLRRPQTRRRIESAARAAGDAVRKLHEAGGRHADLNIRNLLFVEPPDSSDSSSSELDARVIDLDRATLVSEVDSARRMRELMRLLRSLRKLGLLEVVGTRGIAAFFGAYLRGERELRSRLLASRSREELRIALHALGYRS